MQQIKYVTGPCGSHKTTAAKAEIADWTARGYNYILAQPSIDLVDATFESYQKSFPNSKAIKIHSENSDNVATAIEQISRQAAGDPGWAIFCCHTGLMQSPYFHDKQNWHVIFDEVPSPIWYHKLNVKQNRDILLAMLDAEPASEHGYQKLICKNPKRLQERAQDPANNFLDEKLKDCARKMLSGFWDFHVLSSQWNKTQTAKDRKSNGELLIFGLLNPAIFSGYASTTIMSANFHNMLLALYLKSKGVSFVAHRRITNKLAFLAHDNGHLLSIFYAIPYKWSKKIRDFKFKLNGEETDLNQMIAADAMKLFGEDNFAKQVNKDNIKNDPFGDKGERLSFKCYGLNNFTHLHNAAILPALNITPAHYTFLEKVTGIDKDKIHHAIYCEEIYQTCVRISIRNPLDLTPKKIVVADEKAASFLQQMFPGSTRELMPCAADIPWLTQKKAGRPMKYETPEQATLAHRQAQALSKRRISWKRKHQDGHGDINVLYRKYYCRHTPQQHPPSIPVATDTPIRGFTISFWDSHAVFKRDYEYGEVNYSLNKHLISQRNFTTEELFAYLQKQSTTNHASNKYENDLIVPAYFDRSQDPQHGHSKSNHVFSQGIILDIDSGVLSPEQIHNVLKLKMCAYSSWNHSRSNLRYRLAIPTDPMSYDANEAIRRMIVRKLEEAYPTAKHGIDMAKMTPVALFFLPSVRPEGFFQTFEGEGLDHTAWIKACPNDIIDKCMDLSPHTPPDEDEVDEPIPPSSNGNGHSYQTTPAGLAHNSIDEDMRVTNIRLTTQLKGRAKGTGRIQLWSLRQRLGKHTSLSDDEIEAILNEEASMMHNPGERKSEIAALMKDGVKTT